MKEFFRKKLVSLKRNPQIIGLLFLIISCIIFTFSLVVYSNAATGKYDEAYIQGLELMDSNYVFPSIYRNTGMFVFILTLFSFLSVVSYLSVYKGGKTNYFMLAIVVVMIVAMIVSDILYVMSIQYYTGDIYGLSATEDDLASISNSIIHAISLVVSLLTVLLRPLFAKLLSKIKTDVVDEYDTLMEQKSEEELLLELDDEV